MPDTVTMLERLVAFDTTSRNSNLEIIEYLRGELHALGIDSMLVHDAEGRKANLWATFGPADRPGIVLSGHTDVVPVDGQPWSTDPFAVTGSNGRLYGRGTADMKGFLAVCMALAPEIAERDLQTPIHFAFSYDEEVGCLGVRTLLAKLGEMPVRPRGCIIGEPTGMRVIRGHKGKLSMRCNVRGRESHSGLAHKGVNAVEAAAELVAFLKSMARRHRDRGHQDSDFDPPYTTVHTGVIQGGTQLNIVPRDCWFDFEFRNLPVDDSEALLEEVRRYAEEQLLPEMQAVAPESGFQWHEQSRFPGLDSPQDAEVVRLAMRLTGANTTGKVSFGTEGGLFSASGIPAVICGPGYIEQAHKPDEYVALEQLERCEAFVRGLLDELGRP